MDLCSALAFSVACTLAARPLIDKDSIFGGNQRTNQLEIRNYPKETPFSFEKKKEPANYVPSKDPDEAVHLNQSGFGVVTVIVDDTSVMPPSGESSPEKIAPSASGEEPGSTSGDNATPIVTKEAPAGEQSTPAASTVEAPGYSVGMTKQSEMQSTTQTGSDLSTTNKSSSQVGDVSAVEALTIEISSNIDGAVITTPPPTDSTAFTKSSTADVLESPKMQPEEITVASIAPGLSSPNETRFLVRPGRQMNVSDVIFNAPVELKMLPEQIGQIESFFQGRYQEHPVDKGIWEGEKLFYVATNAADKPTQDMVFMVTLARSPASEKIAKGEIKLNYEDKAYMTKLLCPDLQAASSCVIDDPVPLGGNVFLLGVKAKFPVGEKEFPLERKFQIMSKNGEVVTFKLSYRDSPAVTERAASIAGMLKASLKTELE